jgi:DNA-binding IclR family transcriptional regulator
MSQQAPAVARAVKILNLLAAEGSGLPLAALSRRLELPRSSTLVLCNSLAQSRLLVREPTGRYRLGPHVLVLGRSYLAQTDMLTEFQRACSELHSLPDHTLLLGVLDGKDVIYVGRRPGLIPVAVPYEVGIRLPANCTASGKTLLSALAADEVRELLGDAPLPRLTPYSITEVDRLIEDLERARRVGYTTDEDETALGMLCVAAAVRDASARVVGAVAGSMVKTEIDASNLPRYGAEIQRLAARISAGLGYAG